MDFSQRMGLVPAEKPFQIGRMDGELPTALWNAMTVYYWENFAPSFSTFIAGSNFANFVQIYAVHHNIAIDQLPKHWDEFLATLRKNFFHGEWHRAFSFLEYMAENGPFNPGNKKIRADFVGACNYLLKKENSGYRFIQGKIAPITTAEEVEEIETAIQSAAPYAGVRGHLTTALGFLTDRTNPDYRNSIKESISAVETLARHLTNDSKATLGEALKVLEKKHQLEPALKSAFSKLYGYTNDASGIRHSSMEDASSIKKADARFMLICCSAFINYAIDHFED
jgi:hypothetical protein